MNLSDGLAETLKKKFIKFINQEHLSPKSPNTSTNGKNVSWAELDDYASDSKQKKPRRSTPYPNPQKRIKISNSTPKTLSFDDSDLEDQFPKDCSFTTSEDISKLCKSKSQGTKRKRPQNVLSSSEWIVTSCNQIKPDKSNKRCSLNNTTLSSASSSESSKGNSSFEETNPLSDSEEDNNYSQHINDVTDISADGSSRIIVYDKLPKIKFEISSSEDESSDSNTEQIFKLKKLNLSKCQVIKPTIFTATQNQIEISSSKDVSNDSNTKQILKPKKLNSNKCQIIKTTNFTTKQNRNESNNKQVNNETIESVANIVLPKLKPSFGNFVKSFTNETHCILFLKHPVKVYFHGKLYITVLSGAVEILGHKLSFDNKKESEIFSPRGHSYLCFETIEFKSSTTEDLKKMLADYNISARQAQEYLSHLGVSGCVIAVRKLNNNLTNYLSAHVAQHLFPKPIESDKKIEKKLQCLFELDEPSWKTFKKDEKWAGHVETALNCMESYDVSCTMICGGKSVGKSTLFRYMINSLLNRVGKVVCIDLDPGQSEFTIGGCISITILDKPIFGPNFTHLKTPVKSFFVGDVNVLNCLDRYIASVKELLNYCERHITKNYPWVVNTMGFTKSLGTDLIVSVIKLVKPSILLQINSNRKTRNYPSYLTPEYVQNHVYSFPIITPETKVVYDTEVLYSIAEEKVGGEFQFEARHLREMCILSYFSQMIEGGKEITSVAPYGVKLSSIKLHDLGYSKENIPAALNGNLVALCNTKDDTINNQTIFNCFGFGIVRGIDLDSGELYLLTPVPETELDNVNSLIRGNINLPPSLYMKTGRQGLVPYILLGTQRGTSSIPKRSYINLKTLLKK